MHFLVPVCPSVSFLMQHRREKNNETPHYIYPAIVTQTSCFLWTEYYACKVHDICFVRENCVKIRVLASIPSLFEKECHLDEYVQYLETVSTGSIRMNL